MRMNTIPRPEYPRPQLVRPCWINLNGCWEFEIDQSISGRERKLFESEHLAGSITVPFCPESELSGVGFKDFMSCVWYRREVVLPESWSKGVKEAGEKIILHFGAVDYQATVYVNGKEVGIHKGGYSSFCFDITHYISVEDGKAVITLCAEDDLRSRRQPGGKQSDKHDSYGCYYTRTTGIWQTVWLEKLPAVHIESFKLYPDIENTTLRITAQVTGAGKLTAKASYQGQPMGQITVKAAAGQVDLVLPLQELHLWELGAGRLYDLELTFGEDKIISYFGMRSVRMEGMKFLLNGKPVFQRLVLDQGFYPDGIYTAPDEEALEKDIHLSMAAGFNGARLHEKVFEERFLYHADTMGYLVWGEFPDWGLAYTKPENIYGILPEWIEEVERDFNHPAIIGWCPRNETHAQQHNGSILMTYLVTKAMDATRPCIDTSGYNHVKTDIYCVHDYEQDPVRFAGYYGNLPVDGTFVDHYNKVSSYQKGQPMFVSEYGGIRWSDDASGWGYGNAPKTAEEFLTRLEGLTDVLLQNEGMMGFCYTQLTDVEQEQNGLYTYHREPKFDPAVIHAFFSKKAAIED